MVLKNISLICFFQFGKILNFQGMTSLMVDCMNSMLRLWEAKVENDGGQSEMNVDGYFRTMSSDIISKACFGSDYSKGKEIFEKIRALQVIMAKESVGIPGYRYKFVICLTTPYFKNCECLSNRNSTS